MRTLRLGARGHSAGPLGMVVRAGLVGSTAWPALLDIHHTLPWTGHSRSIGRNPRGVVGLIVLLGGCSLLAAVALGQWAGVGGYRNTRPRPWELFDPELVQQTRDAESLYRAAQTRVPAALGELPREQAAQVLYETVASRLTRSSTARHTFSSNWIMWGLGRVRPHVSYIYDADTLLKHGHSVLCHQAALVLEELLAKAGIRSRCVGIGGHVVLEAWYDGRWHLYDVSCEVVMRAADNTVLSIEDVSQNAEQLRQAYAGRAKPDVVDRVVAGFTNPTKHVIHRHETFKSARAEAAAEVLKFIVPGLAVPLGLWLAGGTSRRRSPRRTERPSVVTRRSGLQGSPLGSRGNDGAERFRLIEG